MRRPQPTTDGPSRIVDDERHDGDLDRFYDDAVLGEADDHDDDGDGDGDDDDGDDDGDQHEGRADDDWLLDDADLDDALDDDDEGSGLASRDWRLDADDGLDPFSVAFAGIDVDVLRVAQAMLDQGALRPPAPIADRRHRVSRHPATRRPGRR